MAAGFWLEILIPLRSSVAQNGANQIYFRVNPDIAVVGYTNIPLFVNADTIFRSAMEDNNLTLDLCSLGPVAIMKLAGSIVRGTETKSIFRYN